MRSSWMLVLVACAGTPAPLDPVATPVATPPSPAARTSLPEDFVDRLSVGFVCPTDGLGNPYGTAFLFDDDRTIRVQLGLPEGSPGGGYVFVGSNLDATLDGNGCDDLVSAGFSEQQIAMAYELTEGTVAHSAVGAGLELVIDVGVFAPTALFAGENPFGIEGYTVDDVAAADEVPVLDLQLTVALGVEPVPLTR